MQNRFDREELQAPLSEINMTPLVDVMLVLLVIFLVTAPMLNSAINLNLPNESAKEVSEEKALVISVNRQGEFFLDDEKISEKSLEEKLRQASQINAKQQIHLRADTETSYGKIGHILALTQRAGLSNISFITAPQK